MPPDDPELPPVSAPTSLEPLERTVVALGLRDPLWSAQAPHSRRWFHVRPVEAGRLQLANPRLEGLRRFVILLRHGQPVEEDAITLLRCGFNHSQILEARSLTDSHAEA
ncbi:hypothetical protein [Novosphingobium rosa]|uniref:hypothetical protein n=1 Tax=Novosphingobium rosa TaxID=76978 RepID=UPI00083166FA|nr:hypothetical protein [Novosphingobium rosa]